MSKVTRFVVFVVGVMALGGAVTASAQAVTWHNSGSGTFTATAGFGEFASTGQNVHCSSFSMTGTTPSLTIGMTMSTSGTITGNGCIMTGISSGLDCGYTFTGTSQSGGVTSGTVDLTCGVYQFGAKVCHIGGTDSGTYTNPGTAGVLKFATGGFLNASNGSSGTCPLGNGDRGHLLDMTFRTTSASPPVITRTA